MLKLRRAESDRDKKDEHFPVYAIKAYRVNKGIAPLILNHVTNVSKRWWLTSRHGRFISKETTPEPIEWVAACLSEPVGMFWDRENFLPFPGIKQSSSVVQPVA